MMKTLSLVAMLGMSLAINAAAFAQQQPKYAADVPDSILTPDLVKTERLGDLNFFDGLPSEETVKKVYDYLDTARGVDAFLNGMPAASIYAFLEGMKEAGMGTYSMGITEGLIGRQIAVAHAEHHHDLLRRRNQRQGWSDGHGDSTGGSRPGR